MDLGCQSLPSSLGWCVHQVSWTALVCFSVAAIKYHAQKQLGEEKDVCVDYHGRMNAAYWLASHSMLSLFS